ncbi:MAG: WYL domain-containing protein [Candidatus Dormiibacterota bacterium]
MSDAAVRLLRLLGLLTSGRGLPGWRLAAELGVTERTLRRDVGRLRALGYAITAAPGAGGGYRLGSGPSLPPLPLDRAETMAVAVTLGAPSPTGVAGSEAAGPTSAAKLDWLLPAHLRRQVATLRATTLSLDRTHPTVPAERLVVLAECCHVREKVQFGYRVGDGTSGRRRVEPYRLVATEQSWYLVAHDLDRADWRTFRVDRMFDLERTGHTFIPRNLADPGRLVAQAVTVASYRYRVVVEVAASAETVSTLVPAGASMVEPAGAQARLTFGANRLDWTAAFLIDLGLPFVVQEPPELREHLLELGRRLVATNGER